MRRRDIYIKRFKGSSAFSISKVTLLMGIVCLCFSSCNRNDVEPTSVNQAVVAQSNEEESLFMEETARNNAFQLAVANLARARSQDQQILLHAKRIVDDYRQIQNDLDRIAFERNLVLPNTLSEDDQLVYDSLIEAEDWEFDMLFLTISTDITKESRTNFESFIQNESGESTTSGELNTFAEGYLPFLADLEREGSQLSGVFTAAIIQ